MKVNIEISSEVQQPYAIIYTAEVTKEIQDVYKRQVLSDLILHLDRYLYVYSSIEKYVALNDSCICS